MKNKINDLLTANRCAHILYAYNDRELYLQNAIAYIIDGIEAGDSIVLIENEKNLRLLNKQLNKLLSSSQLEKIQVISNFDFYLSSGGYHPPSIFEYLTKTNTPYLENNISFRTWTNVEWGTLEGPSHIVEGFEKQTDKVVHEFGLTLVCAYEAERMPEDLKSALLKSHPHIMTDEDIHLSPQYQ